MARVKWRTFMVRFLLACTMAALAGCASWTNPPPATHHPTARPAHVQSQADAVVFHAMNLIGTPYHWGGDNRTTGFDCSGLVHYIFQKAVGINLPRTSSAMAQLNAPKITRIQNLASGDLVFFKTGLFSIGHVGIYVGKGRFIDAPSQGEAVQLESLHSRYWRNHFAFARRVLGH